MRKLIGLTVLVLLLFSQQSADAWNRAGHMTSGAIAYMDLKEADPVALARVIEILEEHPEFDSRFARLLGGPFTSSDKRNMRLFMAAARWPDDIRGNEDFDRPEWHFVNHPYKPTDQPSSVETSPPASVNILTAFAENEAILRGTASDRDKAVALCWIFHLIGDVHQPLHSTSLFTTTFATPEGDRGGTRFFIRPSQTSRTISLHSFWDGLIIGSERFRSVRNRATELLERQGHERGALQELSETRFDMWAMPESFSVAEEHAYRQGQLAGSTDRNNGSVLPSEYAGAVQPVAERRIVLAGYRLSDFLAGIF